MMLIQIKSINCELPEEEIQQIEDDFNQALDRFEQSIQEVVITLRDSNGPRGGLDKQCSIIISFFGGGRAVTKATSASFRLAANSASDKMQQVAAKHLSKRRGMFFKKKQPGSPRDLVSALASLD